MRSLILAAAALIAVAAPGVASAQATGYVDASYANISNDNDFGDEDADGWAVGGAVAFDAYALGVQLDANVSNFSADEGDDTDTWNIGGHVFKRTDTWLLGGVVAYGNVDAGGGDSDFWTVGAEGQYYLERATLDAAVTYTSADDADVNITAVDLGGTYFFTDNFTVNAGVGFAQAENDFGDDADAITGGVGAEYQFASVPVSVFGGWSHTEVDDFDLSSDALSIGVRYNFGGETLYQRNRSGASLSRGGAGRFLGLL
jgi:hypothetical protein